MSFLEHFAELGIICRAAKLEDVVQLVAERPERLVTALENACYCGRLDIVERMWGVLSRVEVLHENNRLSQVACMHGHMKVAQWLWTANNGQLDKQRLFHTACEYGHLHIAQWLWDIAASEINPHAEGDKAFRYACVNGCLDVAQWLWAIAPGIKPPAQCDETFVWTWGRRQLDVCDWLATLSPTLVTWLRVPRWSRAKLWL